MPYPFNNDESHKNWQNVVIEFCVYEKMATHRKPLNQCCWSSGSLHANDNDGSTFTMYFISIYMYWNSKSFPIPKMYIRSIQNKNILLYSICHGNCDLVQLAIVKTYTNLAFILLQITTLHLYWWLRLPLQLPGLSVTYILTHITDQLTTLRDTSWELPCTIHIRYIPNSTCTIQHKI